MFARVRDLIKKKKKTRTQKKKRPTPHFWWRRRRFVQDVEGPPARATEEERAAHTDRITREGSVGGRAGYHPPKRVRSPLGDDHDHGDDDDFNDPHTDHGYDPKQMSRNDRRRQETQKKNYLATVRRLAAKASRLNGAIGKPSTTGIVAVEPQEVYKHVPVFGPEEVENVMVGDTIDDFSHNIDVAVSG